MTLEEWYEAYEKIDYSKPFSNIPTKADLVKYDEAERVARYIVRKAQLQANQLIADAKTKASVFTPVEPGPTPKGYPTKTKRKFLINQEKE